MKKTKLRFRLLLAAALILVLLAIVAPYVAPCDPYKTDTLNVLSPPGAGHLLGTDDLGRDVLSRILTGLRISLFSAISVVLVVFAVGTFLGIAAGYFGGVVDRIVMWMITTFQVFPSFLLAVVVAGFLGSGIVNACIALAVVYWTSFARLSRGLVLSIKEQNYVKAECAWTASGYRHFGDRKCDHQHGRIVLPWTWRPETHGGVGNYDQRGPG